MSVFPFIDADAIETPASEELPLLKEYAYDFEKNELLLDKDGRTYMVEKNEALKIWIYKALRTSRFRYVAHSAAYGEEWQDQLVGRSMDGDIVILELERFIIEALMVNPYIKRLDNFVFDTSTSGVSVSFDCTSIYGAATIQDEMKGVGI